MEINCKQICVGVRKVWLHVIREISPGGGIGPEREGEKDYTRACLF